MHAVERNAARARPPRRYRAFTLIEVVVALVVVSLGMLAVIQAVGQTASNSGYLREKTLAHWVAMNRLTEARLQKAAPKIDKTSDEVEMAGRRWKWTMNVAQTPVETIRRIDIDVRPADADEKVKLASVTGFYGAAVAPPGTALISWQGVTDQPGPQVPGGDKAEPEPPPPPPEEEPPAPEEPPDSGDPSDPTRE
jgi:general secretion pathway protein I